MLIIMQSRNCIDCYVFILGNVHLSNVVVVEGVCRLGGAENLVLGLPHPLRAMFAHVKSLNSMQVSHTKKIILYNT